MVPYLYEQNDANAPFLFICSPHILSLQQLPANSQQKDGKMSRSVTHTADSESSLTGQCDITWVYTKWFSWVTRQFTFGPIFYFLYSFHLYCLILNNNKIMFIVNSLIWLDFRIHSLRMSLTFSENSGCLQVEVDWKSQQMGNESGWRDSVLYLHGSL